MFLRKCFFSFSVLLYLLVVVHEKKQNSPQERLAMLVEKYHLTISNSGQGHLSEIVTQQFLDSLEAALEKLQNKRKLTVQTVHLSHSNSFNALPQEAQAHGYARIADGYYAPGGWVIDFDYSYREAFGDHRDFKVENINSRRVGITFGKWVHENASWEVNKTRNLQITARGHFYYGFKNFNIQTDTYNLKVLWNSKTRAYEAWWE